MGNQAYLNFINGEFIPAATGNWLQKRTPRDPSISVELADSSLMDVVRSVQAANKALPNWIKSSSAARAEILVRIATLIEERADEFASAIFEDLGTSKDETIKHSISVAADHFRAHAWSIEPTAAGNETPPIGLIGLIFPASDPLVCFASRVAPALAHGNAVIAKVSRYTPATGVLFAQLVHDAGLPPGVFNCLQGRGHDVGEAVLRHPGISTIAFMGSTETARMVAVTAAETFKKIHYSLGAKNPVLVFANTPLPETISKVARICLGQHPSQSFKGSRLFIQESIFKQALALLKVEIEKIEIAPLAKPENVVRYNEAVQLALKENGKVITTGRELPNAADHSVKPYLFADLTNCSTLQQEEIEGPLILATSFKYQHEALKHANVSPYGRLGFIFEDDPEKALRVAQKLETGSVFINTSEVRFDALEEIPLLKNSGFSPEGGGALAKIFTRQSKIFSSGD